MRKFIKPICFLLLAGILWILAIKFNNLFLSNVFIVKDNIIELTCFLILAVLTSFSKKYFAAELISFNFYKKIILHLFLIFCTLYMRCLWYQLKYNSIPAFDINWIFKFHTLQYYFFLFKDIWDIIEKYLEKNVGDSESQS